MTFTAPLLLHRMGDSIFRILRLPPEIDAALPERTVVTLNESITWHAPLLSLGPDRGRYLVVSTERRRELGLTDGEEVQVHLRADTSPYGMPVPIEWQTLLDEDAQLRELFGALTPSKQRRLLYTVGKPKREATRLQKAVGAATYLLRVGSKEFSYDGLLAALRPNKNGLKDLF